jgi:hypothetical protein
VKTIQVVKADTGEVITSISDYEDGIKGITAKGYKVIADGLELLQENDETSFNIDTPDPDYDPDKLKAPDFFLDRDHEDEPPEFVEISKKSNQ